MASAIQFHRAVKFESKGRVALVGPAGSGKSYTSLVLARELAGPHGRIAAVDTEHGSLSKYADRFDFDVIEPESFSPQVFMDCLNAAEDGGYAVFLCDSLSHFWMGKDGALEWVDAAAKRSHSRDGMAGWKDFSPVERQMVDMMLSSPCHVIVTMRTKTEYQEQEYTNSRGERKKQRVKVGLAPVQRQGLEYEFDLIGYMDENNTLVVAKTRCEDYNGKAIPAPVARNFRPFAEWLKGEKREDLVPRPQAHPITVPVTIKTVADAKLVALRSGVPFEQTNGMQQPSPENMPPLPEQPVKSDRTSIDDMLQAFQRLQKWYAAIGEIAAYQAAIARHGVGSNDESLTADAVLERARAAYREMVLEVQGLDVKYRENQEKVTAGAAG